MFPKGQKQIEVFFFRGERGYNELTDVGSEASSCRFFAQ